MEVVRNSRKQLWKCPMLVYTESGFLGLELRSGGSGCEPSELGVTGKRWGKLMRAKPWEWLRTPERRGASQMNEQRVGHGGWAAWGQLPKICGD